MIEAKMPESTRTLHTGAAFARRTTAHRLMVELIDHGLLYSADAGYFFSPARILDAAGATEAWAKDLVARLVEGALDAEVKP